MKKVYLKIYVESSSKTNTRSQSPAAFVLKNQFSKKMLKLPPPKIAKQNGSVLSRVAQLPQKLKEFPLKESHQHQRKKASLRGFGMQSATINDTCFEKKP